jgi:Zn-finger nucleic acid-binding protein
MKKAKEPLCPECYVEMKPKLNSKNEIIYHECPKCGQRILFTHSGH